MNKPADILKRLRSKFRNTLPIQSFGWEGKNPNFLISLVLDNPLKPLEISVNIEKYLTAHLFYLADKYDQINYLKDSLKVWINKKELKNKTDQLHIYAFSRYNALQNTLQSYFSGYNLNILDTTESSLKFEASLPPINNLMPTTFQIELSSNQIDSQKYSIITNRFADRQYLEELISNIGKDNIRKANKNVLLNIVTETLQRYSMLGLPLTIQPHFEVDEKFKGQIFLHHSKIDTFAWNGATSYNAILRGLTQEKLSYHFIRDIDCNPDYIMITSYVLWKDKKLPLEDA